jgi:phasin
MIRSHFEVPAEFRDVAENTIDQAEQAFGEFFEAANKAMATVPGPGTEISKQALSFAEQNIKAAFDHARKLTRATDLQEAMQLQSDFLKIQFANAGDHMRQMNCDTMAKSPRRMSAASSLPFPQLASSAALVALSPRLWRASPGRYQCDRR